MLRNTYTGPKDVMLCAKPNVFTTVAGNQAVCLCTWLRKNLTSQESTLVVYAQLIFSSMLFAIEAMELPQKASLKENSHMTENGRSPKNTAEPHESISEERLEELNEKLKRNKVTLTEIAYYKILTFMVVPLCLHVNWALVILVLGKDHFNS